MPRSKTTYHSMTMPICQSSRATHEWEGSRSLSVTPLKLHHNPLIDCFVMVTSGHAFL